jgi:excisionase family DNA binding protein
MTATQRKRSRARPRREISLSPRILYTVAEAAAQLSLGERTLWDIIRRGEIATRRVGVRVLVPHAELERFASKDLDTTGQPVKAAPPHIQAKVKGKGAGNG